MSKQLTNSIWNWSPSRSLQPPYIRSLIQTSFFDRNLIACQFPVAWVSERFWLESLGSTWGQVSDILRSGLVDPHSTIHEIERSVGKVSYHLSFQLTCQKVLTPINNPLDCSQRYQVILAQPSQAAEIPYEIPYRTSNVTGPSSTTDSPNTI